MKLYKIYAGLVDYDKYIETAEFETKEDAIERARECAIDAYFSYRDIFGLCDYNDVLNAYMEFYHIEDEARLDANANAEIEEIYQDILNTWIEYYVKEVE